MSKRIVIHQLAINFFFFYYSLIEQICSSFFFSHTLRFVVFICIMLHTNDEYVQFNDRIRRKKEKWLSIFCSIQMTSYVLRVNDDRYCNQRDKRASYFTISTSFRCTPNNDYIEISPQGLTSSISFLTTNEHASISMIPLWFVIDFTVKFLIHHHVN